MNKQTKTIISFLSLTLILVSCTKTETEENTNLETNKGEISSSGNNITIKLDEEIKKTEKNIEKNIDKEEIKEEEKTVEEKKEVNNIPEVKEKEEVIIKKEKIEEKIVEKKQEVKNKVIKLNSSYISPGGKNDIIYTINIEGDTIKSVNAFATNKLDKISEKRIKKFNSAINSAVVGKSINEAKNIDIVGGSSLTTESFRKALKSL